VSGRLVGRATIPAIFSALAASAIGGADRVNAQETQPFDLQNYEFLERQYIFWSPQKIVVNGVGSALGFEAQVGPHVPLVGGVFDRREPIDATHWEWRLIFTFQSSLRLTTAESSPVVTPSYRPQFRLQVLGNRIYGTPEVGAHPPSFRWGVTLDLWSHHSNGQDGCTFNGAVPSGAKCPQIGNGATSLNEHNGSFATDYTGATLVGRYSWGTRRHSRALSLSGALGGQYHHNVPAAGLSDAPDSDLTQLWGHWHGSGEVELRWNILNQEDSAAGEPYLRCRLDLASGGSDLRLPGVSARHDARTAELGWVWSKLYGLGVFARVVAGREYYNIEFTQSPTRLQFGVVIDTAGHVPELKFKPVVPPGGP
jgi:hypothetical protein